MNSTIAAVIAATIFALSPVATHDTKTFSSFVKYLTKQRKTISIPQAGSKFALGSATVTILGPITVTDDTNNSSIVRNTAYLRDAFPGKLSGMALLEDRGDGAYVLCDETDRIWFFTPELSIDPTDSGMDLIDYTLKRHEESR